MNTKECISELLSHLQPLFSGILTTQESISLQFEIESHYIPTGNFVLGQRNNDIRTRIFNFENPHVYTKIKNLEFRIIDGLIEGAPYSGNRKKTYLLYLDYQIIGKFYLLSEAKLVIKEIDFYINKNK
jgi:hypothetical protein